MKKILLGFGTMMGLAVPVGVVVSCGNGNESELPIKFALTQEFANTSTMQKSSTGLQAHMTSFKDGIERETGGETNPFWFPIGMVEHDAKVQIVKELNKIKSFWVWNESKKKYVNEENSDLVLNSGDDSWYWGGFNKIKIVFGV